MTSERAHRLARERGVSPALYRLVRSLVVPFMRAWFRLSISGADHIPASGRAIIAPNHKSFFDSFFIAAATWRPVRYMGKAELFAGPQARLLIALGAFPVRRGEADAEALETARAVLAAGELLSLFPEGTRVRDPDALGTPRRGAARLALEYGAPLIPAAITGTERLFLAGVIPKPRKVRVALGEPISVEELSATPETAAVLVDEHLWPEIESQFRGLRARKGLIAAAAAALLGGGAAAVARSRGGGGPRLRRSGGGVSGVAKQVRRGAKRPARLRRRRSRWERIRRR